VIRQSVIALACRVNLEYHSTTMVSSLSEGASQAGDVRPGEALRTAELWCHSTLLHKSPDMHDVKYKLVKNTLPSHQVKHDDTRVPPSCRRAKKQAIGCHSGWLDLSLKRVLSVEFVELSPKFPGNCRNYTRRSERHSWALLKRSYQAA
jgi:hypothetical protein